MTYTLVTLALMAATGSGPADANPIFKDLVAKGITVFDGTSVRLPSPIMPDGLDAAAQRAAMDRVGGSRWTAADLIKKSFFAPVAVKVRTAKKGEDEGPLVRTVDVWFVAHGDWNILNSKDFLETVLKTKDEGKSQVVLKSGVLTDKELAARKLTATVRSDYEQRYPYATIRLFDLVQLSMTRHSVMTKGKDSIVTAGRVDPRFADDPEFPNEWRPLKRDAQANTVVGRPHPFSQAGGYAKVTRLKSPAGALFVECHLVYQEEYGWFEGATLVKQKLPIMVQEKVRTFRRKLTLASEKPEEKGNK